MPTMLQRLLPAALLFTLLVALPACNGDAPDRAADMDFRGAEVAEVTISPRGNQLRFEQTEFTVRPGQTVRLTMDNVAQSPAMVHNVLIVNSNDDEEVNRVGRAALRAGRDRDYIPDDDAVIASTPQAQPGEVTDVEFTAPDEPGDFRYICTYPGHFSVMQGVMRVQETD